MAKIVLDREYQVEACCGRDEKRDNLTSCEVRGNRIYATDGHVLASVPIAVQGEGANGSVDAGLVKLARQQCKRGPTALVLDRRHATLPNGGVYERADRVFPKVEELLLKAQQPHAEGFVTVALDAGLLLQAARALGTNQLVLVFHPEVSRRVHGSAEAAEHPHAAGPVTVHPFQRIGSVQRPAPENAVALLMPIALDWPSK